MEARHISPTLPRDLRVLLGMSDLNDPFEIGRETIAPLKIHVHDDWNPQTVNFDADIALIELENGIKITKYIQPICLWDSNSDPSPTSGVVVGYGKSEDMTKAHENIQKTLETPIHSNEDCFLEKPALVALSSKRTFCGGKGDGSGVCNGKNIFFK